MSTKVDGIQSNTKRFLTSFFGSSAVVPENPRAGPLPLLELPRPVRVKIWRLLGFAHTRTLRLVCSLIKEDIEAFTGISSAIDSTYEDFPFHCNVAIRKVVIHELITPAYIQFLKYPEILQELEIRGEISVQNFHYIIKSCPNISKLLVVFNKFVLEYRTPFFPLPLELLHSHPLSKLRSLKFISTTRKLAEMVYVHQIAISMFRDSLSNVKITSLHVLVTHKATNEHFRETVWATLLFVHKHVTNLRYLNLTFRDRDISAGVGENPAPAEVNHNHGSATSIHTNATPIPMTLQHPPKKLTSRTKRLINVTKAGSSSPKEKIKPEVVKPIDHQKPTTTTSTTATNAIGKHTPDKHHHAKAIHSEDAGVSTATDSPEGEGEAHVSHLKKEETNEESNAAIRNSIQYLLQNKWPKAENLEQLLLTMSQKYMEELLNIVSPHTKLQVLQLEMVGGGESQPNWPLYQDFILRGNTHMLKYVSLFAANNVSSEGQSLPIDLSIFRKSKGLRKLTILCQKRDDFSKLARVRGISELPQALAEVNFERMHLTPWQVVRLLICFDEMYCLSLAYWSISDCQFCTLLRIMKWIIKLDITDVHKICLVDTKLRFKNKRQAVRGLQEAISISARYQDLEETRLVIDMTQKRDLQALAPELRFKKVQSLAQKPQQRRNPKQKVDNNVDNLSLSSQLPT